MDTTFTAKVTKILAAWLQDVNDLVYRGIGTGGVSTPFLQSGTGAVAETVQVMGRRIVWASQYGSGFTTTPGADIAAAITALGANGGIVELPAGSVTLEAQVSVPSNILIRGRGAGITTLTAKNSLNAHMIVNSDSTNGNTDIHLQDLSLEGNYANQTTGNGIAFTKNTNNTLTRVAVKNCRGTGITLSGGSNNRLSNCEATDNGIAAAGYGIYLFNSNRNRVQNCTTNNNCLGIALEGNGAGETAEHNVIIGNTCKSNRADFSQAGAGIYLEEGASGTVGNNLVIGNTCELNAGSGISITAGTGVQIVGNHVHDNLKSGITGASAIDVVVSSNSVLDNGASDAVGYQCGIRFDDTGVTPASTGLVVGNRCSGSVEGIKTFSTSTLTLLGNDVRSNSTNAINLSVTGSDRTMGNRGYDLFDRDIPAIELMDDFLGDVLADQWNGRVGTDPQCTAPAIIANQQRGLCRMITGDDAGGTMALNGVQLESDTNWRVDQGRFAFECRFMLNDITNSALFVGMTDQVAALEMPFTLGAGDALTSNASNAFGVLYDSAADTDNWWLVGVATDVDATKQNSAVAPANSVFETWRIEVTTAGAAVFFRNGALIGSSMAGAVTPGTLLTPVVTVFSRNAVGKVVDVDFIRLKASR